MSDKPFYAHDAEPPAPRRSAPGEHVWTMVKKGHVYRAELRPRDSGLCELQILLGGELRVGHLHPSREGALAEAKIRQRTLVVRDWKAATPEGEAK